MGRHRHAIAAKLIPTRALMALESFRQLITRCAGHDGSGFRRQALGRMLGCMTGCRHGLLLRRRRAELRKRSRKSPTLWKPRRNSASAATKTRFRCSIPATSRRLRLGSRKSARSSRCRSRSRSQASPSIVGSCAGIERIDPRPRCRKDAWRESHGPDEPSHRRREAEASASPAIPPPFRN